MMVNFQSWVCKKSFVYEDTTGTEHTFDHTGHYLQTRFFAGQIMFMLEPVLPPGGTKYWKKAKFAFGHRIDKKGRTPVKKLSKLKQRFIDV